MKFLFNTFRRRLSLLVALLALAILVCSSLAVLVQRKTSSTLRRLAKVELEAAMLARQFRTDVHDLHGALLRIGNDKTTDDSLLIQQRRQRLNDWLTARLAAPGSDEEKQILERLDAEMHSYFMTLDELAKRTDGFKAPLDRESIIMCDDGAFRLQNMAGDFAAAHDKDLRDLLQESLSFVLWMRNLFFICLALLVTAIGVIMVVIYRDVVRPLREQLVDSKSLLVKREKLAALGTLAAGVAHEIRNPLTAIKARLYTLRSMPTSDHGEEDVHAITKEVDRMERIVRDVLGYARPEEPALDNVELSAWLREFTTVVEPDVTARGIKLSVDAEATACVYIDANQLHQIMLNLVRNAQEALAGRPGSIVLSLHRERMQLRGKLANVAVLTVTDDGPGIPAEIHPRLFDPFFTTKAAGTGLGLSIVARLVEIQGGEIAFQSAPNVCTRFAVRLPISEDVRQTGRP